MILISFDATLIEYFPDSRVGNLSAALPCQLPLRTLASLHCSALILSIILTPSEHPLAGQNFSLQIVDFLQVF